MLYLKSNVHSSIADLIADKTTSKEGALEQSGKAASTSAAWQSSVKLQLRLQFVNMFFTCGTHNVQQPDMHQVIL